MSSYNYLAILGRQAVLGLMELESVLGAPALQPFGAQAALLSELPALDRLGGIMKSGRVLYRGPAVALSELPVEPEKLVSGESKTPFALSVYGLWLTPPALMAAGLQLKRRLKPFGSARLIAPARGTAVSAAELRHNRVLSQGFELLVVCANGEMVVACTEAVQNIDWYSKRDYERPSRSAKVGMLPPKLAQMLVNTTSAPVVADPFCGTGVVMQEARLLGRVAWGSDLSNEMVAASRTNMNWLQDQVEGSLPDLRVEAGDARHIVLPKGAAVVSEGYLGPNLSRAPEPGRLASIKQELLDLYRESLLSWSRQMAPGGEVSLCVPAWRLAGGWSYLGLVDELPRLGYTLKGFKHVSTPLLYARDDQVVGRQLLLLRKL